MSQILFGLKKVKNLSDEGEFKKRIIDKAFRFPTGDGYVRLEQGLLNDIDEARKDLLENATVLNNNLLVIDRHRFLKWFGSKKEEADKLI